MNKGKVFVNFKIEKNTQKFITFAIRHKALACICKYKPIPTDSNNATHYSCIGVIYFLRVDLASLYSKFDQKFFCGGISIKI